MLVLDVEGLTEEQGRAIEARCRERGAWPVRFRPPRRRRIALLGPREVGPTLSMPEQLDSGRHLLSDHATWDAPAWAMEPDLLPLLAEAVRVLGDELPQGFSLRATWVGSEARHEHVLTADNLVGLVLASRLNEFTSYRVPPCAQVNASGPHRKQR
jgi:hypothetical protein